MKGFALWKETYVDAGIPVFDDNSSSCDFDADGNGIAIITIPSDGKPKRGVNVS